jgi:Ca2+/Na+ antiporter
MSMDERKVEVEVRLEPGDYLRATGWAMAGGRRLTGCFFSVVILTMLFSFVDSVVRGHPTWVFLIFPGLAVLFVLYLFYASKRQTEKESSAGQVRRYTISDAGVDLVSPLVTSHSDWSSIGRVVETKNQFLILSPLKVVTQVLPKRCFTGPEQLALFRELVAAHVPAVEAPGEKRSRWLKVFLLWLAIFIVVILLYNVFQSGK